MMLTLEALLKNEKKNKKQKRVYGMLAGNFKK
jgi:hypothetical protein